MKNKEYKGFQFKLEDVDSKGVIRGYASTFGNIDLGDDIVEQGAFKKTLKETKGVIPILDSHDSNKQIGWNLRAAEDDKGLFVEGELVLESNEAKQKYELAKKAQKIGAKMGLSIGYYTIKAVPDKERPSLRRIKEVRLFEYSIVTFPMNTMASITDVKNQDIIDGSKVIEEANNRGITTDEFTEALQNGAAKTYDPACSQLLGELISLFERR